MSRAWVLVPLLLPLVACKSKGPGTSPARDVASWTLAIRLPIRRSRAGMSGHARMASTSACEVGGVKLEEGALVTLCIGAANRDPAQFEAPDTLRLDRENNRHLAFGFGIHQCAGLSLARLEGRIAIGRFLARFPHYQLTASPTRGGRARFRGFLQAPFRVA